MAGREDFDIIRLVEACQHAGAMAARLQPEIVVELKPDGSIVTEADRAIETYFREVLPDIVPGSAVWGEEFGYAADTGKGVWLVDPIDGTSNYAFGGPLWGISVALARDSQIVAGVIALPGLGETYSATLGKGGFCNGKPLKPIRPGPVQPHELVSICGTTLRAIPSSDLVGKQRCSGAFVIDGAFVARQRLRGLVGMNEYLYDVAASVILCQELGADVRYWDGSPFDTKRLLEGHIIDKPWVVFPASIQ